MFLAINLKDESDVQIWCDYQEETKQTSADYFLRLRFYNFRIFVVNARNYGNRDGSGCGHGNTNCSGNGYGIGLGYSYGIGCGYGNGYGNTWGDGHCNGKGENTFCD